MTQNQVYKLEVVAIPPNKPTTRQDFSDKVFKTETGKFTAVIKEIEELNKKGQPICTRLGAAVDFIIPDMNMRVVANWIATRTPFDRLYFYGDDRPIHVSYGPDNKQDYVDLVRSLNGRQIPKNNKAYKERKSRISEIYKNIMGVCDTDFIALSDQEFAELEQKILNE